MTDALRAGLRGDLADEIAALERALARDPNDAGATASLIEAYRDGGRDDEARTLAARALARWPSDAGVALAVARGYETDARPADGLELLRSGAVDLATRSPAYPIYLRLLIEAEHHEEAVLEAMRGLDSLWAVDARLALAVALLHFGDDTQAVHVLGEIPWPHGERTVRKWARAVAASPCGSAVSAALRGAARWHPEASRLHDVVRALNESAGTTP